MWRLFAVFFVIPVAVFGQKIENLKAEAQGPVIVITYDLRAADPSDTYNITITSSATGFKTALRQVSGDVGKGVKPGSGKKITWQAQAELIKFKGEISFEVQGEVIAALAFSPPLNSVKRGTSQLIRWRGGDSKQDVRVELLKDGAVSATLGTVQNAGSYSWAIPSNQKPGTYGLRLTNGRETVTQDVTIKHKVPTLVKVIPVVAVGAAVAVVAGGAKPKDSNNNPSTSDLPLPPDILD